MPTFAEFLLRFQGPGVGAAVGAILTFLAEFWPYPPSGWFHKLDPKKKRLVYGGGCFLLPVCAACLACGLGYQVWSFDQTFWPALWNGGTAAFSIGTLVHTAFMRKR